MSKLEVIICHSITEDLTAVLNNISYDKLFVLCDSQTRQHCFPLIQNIPVVASAHIIEIEAGEESKNIDSLAHVWQSLSQLGATRRSLIINIGGGMVTDLGGFAAASFKRGLKCINIPTTLLSMVDAAVGGKTGINFNGLKNEVGVFSMPISVLIDTQFLKTIDRINLLSGFAEMLKHGLLNSEEEWNKLVSFNLDTVDYEYLAELVGISVAVKERIVEQDPLEKGIRKALNLGHTVGHAFESLALEQKRTIAHGYAVAYGLICELYLSFEQCGFPKERLQQVVQFVKENYGAFPITCKQYERLYELMQHDKKNESGIINFTLLNNIGNIQIDQTSDKEQLFKMFDFYCFCLGL